MVYISAQPDQVYFIWQLEIQLRNLASLGIPKDRVRVIVAYNLKKGLNPSFQSFIDSYEQFATFFTYPDKRTDSKYTSSIRPNVLKQHFEKYPELEKEVLFYHDSDVLFSRVPEIGNDEQNDICYVSDTRSYLDIHYIRNTSSEELLENMLDVVGITKEKVQQEASNTGGAQYILKGINAAFWGKVELDSERLYTLMRDHNQKLWEKEYPEKREFRSKRRGIQAWCADMWAVLWNLWYTGKKVEIHSELDFSWPYSPVEDWYKKSIQHYSGIIKDKTTYFKKSEYKNYMPWYDDSLGSIPESTCSYKIVEQINRRKQELYNLRPKYRDITIFLYALQLNDACSRLYNITKRYYSKLFNIVILNTFNHDLSLTTLDLNRIAKDQLDLTNTESLSRLLWIPFNCVMTRNCLELLLNAEIENYSSNVTFIRSEDPLKVDRLFSETFSKVLDDQLLTVNCRKFNSLATYDEPPIIIQKFGHLALDFANIKTNDASSSSEVDNFILDNVFYLT